MYDSSLILPRVYGPDRARRLPSFGFLISCIVCMLGAVLLLVLVILDESLTPEIIPAILLAILGLVSLYLYVGPEHMRLILFYDGLIFYGNGYIMYTPWQNIQGSSSVSLIGKFKNISGLQLRNGAHFDLTLEEAIEQGVAVIITSWWVTEHSMKPFINFFPIDPIIEGDIGHYDELWHYLLEYAPQAFEQLPPPDLP